MLRELEPLDLQIEKFFRDQTSGQPTNPKAGNEAVRAGYEILKASAAAGANFTIIAPLTCRKKSGIFGLFEDQITHFSLQTPRQATFATPSTYTHDISYSAERKILTIASEKRCYDEKYGTEHIKTRKQFSQPNAAHAGIIELYRAAAKKFANNNIEVTPLEYENKSGIFGLFKDEVAYFSTHFNTPNSPITFDVTHQDFIYSAKHDVFTIVLRRHTHTPSSGDQKRKIIIRGHSLQDMRGFLAL